ncbi:MAG: hypothetical protein COT06_00455, partial [Syntrophobacteraceae bacterium CG07_land_8_20_14_0_80_61_8]
GTGGGKKKTMRSQQELQRNFGRMKPGDMAPHHQPHGRQHPCAKPARHNGVVPPFHLNDVSFGDSTVE